MEYKKYALPKEDEERTFACDSAPCPASVKDLRHSLIDKEHSDSFENEWKRSVSIEEFRMQCKNKLNAIYG